jgi:tetratricopeptide (TPR) repeat protein
MSTGTAIPKRARPRAASLALAAALAFALAAYGRVLHGAFHFDDSWLIVNNLAVKSADGLLAFLRSASLTDRPVTTVTFALNYALGALDPFGYHLVNVAIHLGTAFLLFLLGQTLLLRAHAPAPEWVAAAAAGTFALHPLNSQAVSYVAQRSESLATLLAAATLLLLLAAERSPSVGRRAGWIALASIAFLLAVETKLPAVVAPALWAVAAVAFPLDPGQPLAPRLRRIAAIGAPLLLLGGILVAATFVRLRGHNDVGLDVPGIGPWRYLLTQAHAVLLYVRLLVVPVGQSVEHDLPLSTSLDPATAAAAVTLLGALALGLRLLAAPPRGWSDETRASGRVVGFGIVWWFVALAPSSSIIPVRDLAVEHRVYMASFGLLLAAAACVERALARLPASRRPHAVALAMAIVWIALGVTLHGRNAVWESELALWSDAAAKAPTRVRPLVNEAYARQVAGDLVGAAAGYRRALALPEDPAHTRARISFYLGSVLVLQHRPAEAYAVLSSGLASDPWNPDLLNGLAIASLDLGRPADAERFALAALRIDPASGKAVNSLGEAHLAQQRPEAALGAFLRAAALDPDSVRRQYNVALTASRLGRRDEACAAVARYRRTRGDAALDAEVSRLASDLACAAAGDGR